MTRFPTDLTERDWAVLDCYVPLAMAIMFIARDPSWVSVAFYLAFWWVAVYFQWAKKLRTVDRWLQGKGGTQ